MSAPDAQNNNQNILAGVQIPPRPQLLADIDHEFQKSDPSFTIIANLIARDVSLTASVLKTVNSPFFGLAKRVTSIPFAVQMVGLKNIKCLVTGLLLKQTMNQNQDRTVEQFWDSAERVAKMSAQIAGMLPKVPRDYAYTFGLFREIGIPLMLKRFPEYKETLRLAFNEKDSITDVEEAIHHTNHAIVGRMVARTWLLPEEIYEGIAYHHNLNAARTGEGISTLTHTLIMINYLAENLIEGELRVREYGQWCVIGPVVLDYLGITQAEVDDLKIALLDGE